MTNDEETVATAADTGLASDASAEEITAVFRRLRALRDDCMAGKRNKDETVAVLINACIDEGFTAGKRITGAIATLGFNRQHAGQILQHFIGVRWERDEDRNYRNLV